MNQESIFFKKLTAEESSVIIGGDNLPIFVVSSTNPTQEGQIWNVDGNGKTINLSTASNSQSISDNASIIDPLALALPSGDSY